MILKILRRPQAKVDIHLDRDRLVPGEVVNGTVSVTSRKGFDFREIAAALECIETYWHWEYNAGSKSSSKNKKKRHLVKELASIAADGKVKPDTACRGDFRFVVPDDGPLSIAGKSANISWKVRVSLDVPGARDLHEDQPFFVVSPVTRQPSLAKSERELIFNENSNDDCKLRLGVESGLWLAGDSVSGRLRLDAVKDCESPEIRIELVRSEIAKDRSSEVVADSSVVQRDASYGPGRGAEWRFDLRVPEGFSPTSQIGHTRVDWMVRGVFSRPRRRDYSVEQEITVA